MPTCVILGGADMTGSLVMARYSSPWSDETKERFATLVLEMREMFGENGTRCSQDSFGKMFDTSGTTVQGWERGSIPEIPTLKKIASLLSWSLDELVHYLETGERPIDQSELVRLLQKVSNISLQDLAVLLEAGNKRLVAEVKTYRRFGNIDAGSLPPNISPLGSSRPKRATPGGV